MPCLAAYYLYYSVYRGFTEDKVGKITILPVAYLYFEWNERVFNVESKLFVPKGIEIFEDCFALVNLFPLQEELDVRVRSAAGVLGR